MSASLASAYTVRIKFRLKRENLRFSRDLQLMYFLSKRSNSRVIPIKNKTVKLAYTVKFFGINEETNLPNIIEIQSIRLQIRLITIKDFRGIFILEKPYDKAAVNASVEIEVASSILSINRKNKLRPP